VNVYECRIQQERDRERKRESLRKENGREMSPLEHEAPLAHACLLDDLFHSAYAKPIPEMSIHMAAYTSHRRQGPEEIVTAACRQRANINTIE
jgi:DNA replication protein DnaD